MLSFVLRHFCEFGYILLFASCAFAWLKGGPAERWGSVCLGLNWIITALISPAIPYDEGRLYLNLVLDISLAVAFLLLAFRFSSIWLGSCMTLQGATLTLQSMQWTGSGTNAATYYLLNNLISLLVLSSIVGGTIATWRKRRSERRSANLQSAPLSVPA